LFGLPLLTFPPDVQHGGFATTTARREHAGLWFDEQKTNIFMTSWTGTFITHKKISCPELHEYPEGVNKGSIALAGEFLNMLNPRVKIAFERLVNTTIHKDLRRLSLCWLQVQMKPFTTGLVSAVGEEYKTWMWMMPYFCAILESLESPQTVADIAGPVTPEEVDIPLRQGGTWTLPKCLTFLTSRMCSIDRTFYQDMDYYPQMYSDAAANGTVLAVHAKFLVKKNWQKRQARIEALPSRTIGMLAAVHSLTAAMMDGTSCSSSIAELKRRSARFVSATNDVDSCMRDSTVPPRQWAIFRKAVFISTLMHAYQVQRLGQIHFMNEQAAEETFHFSKSGLRKNPNIKPHSLLTQIERKRNAIRFKFTMASAAQQIRNQVQTLSVTAQAETLDAVEGNFALLVSSTHKLSHASDSTTKQRKVYTYASVAKFVERELFNREVAVVSCWYSTMTNHVYIETKTTVAQPVETGGGAVLRYLTELKIGMPAYQTTMRVRNRREEKFHFWSPLGVPDSAEATIHALTSVAGWVDIALMGLQPAVALRHPQQPKLFFFQTLRGRQKKAAPSWAL